jgi:DNA-binding LacI/PurR family transcriptional regulator
MNPIAVIPKSTTHLFWRAVEAGAREGAKEAGVEMIWKGSLREDDPAQQIQIVQQFVSEGVGGIFLAPIDDTALRGPVAAAMQKGIPVVIMDSPLKGEPLAIGRSKLGPSFLTSAGARLMVILWPLGHRRALLQMADVTRSLLSFTAVSGSPTTAILSGLPHPAWASISTSKASTPTTAAE